jgi:hypothetical protein
MLERCQGVDLQATIRKAHRDLLMLSIDDIQSSGEFYLSALDGALACEISGSEDLSLKGELCFSVRARTYLPRSMLNGRKLIEVPAKASGPFERRFAALVVPPLL